MLSLFKLWPVLIIISNKLIHDDLKPRNILVYQEDNRQVLKIADWGTSFSDYCGPRNTYYNVTTLWYRAPQILWYVPYGYGIDLWSMDVYYTKFILVEFCFLASLNGPESIDNERVRRSFGRS